MRLPILILTSYIHYNYAFSIPRLPRLEFASASQSQIEQHPLQDSLDTWIDQQEQISLDKLFANIAPGGRNVEGKGVAPGTVIASPSQDEPDYWYQWVRDAAITMNTVVNLYEDSPSSTLETILTAYASLQRTLQHTSNPSGTFSDLSSLGEPKFHVDGRPFTGSWGRPQRDGPALRALTLMRYVRAYNASHPNLWSSPAEKYIFEDFYRAELPVDSIIKADLEYVSHYWNESSFDLWEEIEGIHFFNLMVSARSLGEGAEFAGAFEDYGAQMWYAEQAGYVERLIRKFWNKKKGHLVETLWSKRSGLDCGVLLGSLYALPESREEGDAVFPPWSDEVLATLVRFVEDQDARFPINSNFNSKSKDHDSASSSHSSQLSNDSTERMNFTLRGTALGRYPEDRYNGYTSTSSSGNPWFLCTLSAAELLYRVAEHFLLTSHITVSPISLPFFGSLLPNQQIKPGTYKPADPEYEAIVNRVMSTADEFLEVVRTHADEEGSMSEQFDRHTGYMTGARDLSWSYGAFLRAKQARDKAREALDVSISV